MPATIELPRTDGPGTGMGGSWKVIVRNDSHNTFDHVATTLARVIPGMTLDAGYAMADAIHNKGLAIVWIGHAGGRRALLGVPARRRPDDGSARAGLGCRRPSPAPGRSS